MDLYDRRIINDLRDGSQKEFNQLLSECILPKRTRSVVRLS
jgi:hypothetical protein